MLNTKLAFVGFDNLPAWKTVVKGPAAGGACGAGRALTIFMKINNI